MSRLTATIRHSDGTYTTLGPAEPVGDIGQDVTFGSTMPGGYQSASMTVARDPALHTLEPFDELIIRDAGNVEVWSGYGIEYPVRDGDGPSVEISATGWQSYLKDNAPPPLIAVDRRFDSWEGPSAARRADLLGIGRMTDKAYTSSTGDGLTFLGDEGQPITKGQTTELNYTAPTTIREMGYRAKALNTTNILSHQEIWVSPTDDTASANPQALTIDNTVRHVEIPAGMKTLVWQLRAGAAHTPTAGFSMIVDIVAVYGDHQIPLVDNGVDGMKGVRGSDLIHWALREACPMLTAEITPTTFVIPHFTEPDLESAEDLILRANAVDLYDWAVWGRTFVYRPTGQGRTWVVRSSDPGVTLTDAGQQGDDTYTRVIVRFSDPAGKALRVGYPGSDADVESEALINPVPNAATRHGRDRTGNLNVSANTTADYAIRAGQMWLEEMALLNQRGDATLTGTAQDTLGVTRNVTQIRAGDQIIFADRTWTPRRIVEATYTEETDQCAISLDTTPSKVDALFERWGFTNEAQNV